MAFTEKYGLIQQEDSRKWNLPGPIPTSEFVIRHSKARPSRLRRQGGADQFLVVTGKHMAVRKRRRGPRALFAAKK